MKEKFGFRKNVTTEKATYELTNEIICVLNDKLIIGRIFCALAKAFACINHYTLLFKLNFYGINSKANKWTKSCFMDRYQRVEINNKNFSHHTASKWGKIRHSVPKGSTLDPLLFLLYINDFSNC
jgi:hypothetical protein